MKLVVDTNKLFTFFWKGSLIKKLLFAGHDLYSPEFALQELESHKSEIMLKTKINLEEYEYLKNKLSNNVVFVSLSKYKDQLTKALSLNPDNPKDVDFLALALKLNASIVSDDKELKNQSEIRVFNKKEYSELF